MATLNISDLSVGDWVYYDKGNKPYSIRSIYSTDIRDCVILNDNESLVGVIAFDDELTPIPITAEILEKNEVHKTYEDDDYAIFRGDGLWAVKYSDGDWELSTPPVCRVDIKYVHQLQHALRVAGVGKEINL